MLNSVDYRTVWASVVPISRNTQKLIGWAYYWQLLTDFFHYRLFEILF